MNDDDKHEEVTVEEYIKRFGKRPQLGLDIIITPVIVGNLDVEVMKQLIKDVADYMDKGRTVLFERLHESFGGLIDFVRPSPEAYAAAAKVFTETAGKENVGGFYMSKEGGGINNPVRVSDGDKPAN